MGFITAYKYFISSDLEKISIYIQLGIIKQIIPLIINAINKLLTCIASQNTVVTAHVAMVKIAYNEYFL